MEPNMILKDPTLDEKETETETSGPGWTQSGRTVLRYGWWVGKRVAIAGAAITSAPVVIPPLLLLSSIGLAFAFPFSIYFASFVCTDRVMRSLLPLPLPIELDGDREDVAETQEEEEMDLCESPIEEAGCGEIETPDRWSDEMPQDVCSNAAETPEEGETEMELFVSFRMPENVEEVKDEEVYGRKSLGEARYRELVEEVGRSGETESPDTWSEGLTLDVYPSASVMLAERKTEIEQVGAPADVSPSGDAVHAEGRGIENEKLSLEKGGEEKTLSSFYPSVVAERQVEIRPRSQYRETDEDKGGTEIVKEGKMIEGMGTEDEIHREDKEKRKELGALLVKEDGIEIEHQDSKEANKEKTSYTSIPSQVAEIGEDRGDIEMVREGKPIERVGMGDEIDAEDKGKREDLVGGMPAIDGTTETEDLSVEEANRVERLAGIAKEEKIQATDCPSEYLENRWNKKGVEMDEEEKLEKSIRNGDDKAEREVEVKQRSQHGETDQGGNDMMRQQNPLERNGTGAKIHTEDMGESEEMVSVLLVKESGIEIEHLSVEEANIEEQTSERVPEEKTPWSSHPSAAAECKNENKPKPQHGKNDGDQGGIQIMREGKPMERIGTGDEIDPDNKGKREELVCIVPAKEGEIEIKHLSLEEAEGTADRAKEVKIQSTARPSVATEHAVGISPISEYPENGRNKKDVAREEKLVKSIQNGDENAAIASKREKGHVGAVTESGIVMQHLNSEDNRDEGGFVIVQEDKQRHEEAEEKRRKEDQAGVVSAHELPQSTYPIMDMVSEAHDVGIEPSSLRTEDSSLPDERSEESIEILENLKPLEGTGERRENIKGERITIAVPEGKEPLQKEHKIEDESSAAGKSRGDIEMVEEEKLTGEQKQVEEERKEKKRTSTAASEALPNSAHPSRAVELNEYKREGEPSCLSSEYLLAGEDHSSDVPETKSRGSVGHGLDDETYTKEDQAEVLSAHEPHQSTYPIVDIVSEEEEVGIEPSSLRAEHPSFPDEKSEESLEILEKVKPLEGTGEQRENIKGQRINFVVPEGKEPLQEEHKIEDEPSAAEKSRRDTDMVEENQLTEDKKQVEEERKEKKSTSTAVPNVSSHPSRDVELSECKSEGEPSCLSSEYASAVEDHSSDVAETESRGSIGHGLNDEGLQNKQKIWEQILAIRMIVGYKGVLRSSLARELRALYLFTGVEPPTSFNDASDLEEVSDTLQFLKSVIGVI